MHNKCFLTRIKSWGLLLPTGCLALDKSSVGEGWVRYPQESSLSRAVEEEKGQEWNIGELLAKMEA